MRSFRRFVVLCACALPLLLPACGGSDEAGGGDYCEIARRFRSLTSNLRLDTPAAIEQSFQEVRATVARAQRVAPEQLKPDLTLYEDRLDTVIEELAATGYDISLVSPQAIELFTSEEFNAAQERIEGYHRDVCGITDSPTPVAS